MTSVPLVLYVAASAAYATYFARRSDTAGRFATLMLVCGALAHAFVIGMMDEGEIESCLEATNLPVLV